MRYPTFFLVQYLAFVFVSLVVSCDVFSFVIVFFGCAVAGVAYSLTQAPRSLDEDPAAVSQSVGAISTTRYFGVGSTAMYNAFENLSDSGNLGMAFTSAYRPAHSGWVGVQTYTDNHGNFRVKTEVLVAMSGIQTGNEPYPNYKA